MQGIDHNKMMRQTASTPTKWAIRGLTLVLVIAALLVGFIAVRDTAGATSRSTTWTWHVGTKQTFFDDGCANYNVWRRHHGQKPLDCHVVVWQHYTDPVRRSCPACATKAQPDAGGYIWQQRQEYDVHALDYLWSTETHLAGFYYPAGNVAWIEHPHYGYTGLLDCSGQGTTFTGYSQGTCESYDLFSAGLNGVSGWNRWGITIGIGGYGATSTYWVNVRLWPKGHTVWDAGT